MKDTQGPDHLRRQGGEPAQPRAPVLQPTTATRATSCRCSSGIARRHRDGRRQQREGGAAPREHADQEAPAALQRQARDDKNYLVLRLDPEGAAARASRSCGASATTARTTSARTTRRRSCRETLRVVNRHFQLRTCTDHVLHNRAAALPAVPDQALPGALRAAGRRARSTASRCSDVRAVPRGQERRAARAAARAHEGGRGARREFEVAGAAARSDRARSSARSRSSAWSRPTSSTRTCSASTARAIALEIVVLSIRSGKLLGRPRLLVHAGRSSRRRDAVVVRRRSTTTSARSSPTRCCCRSRSSDAAAQGGVAGGEARRRRRKVEVLVPQRGAARTSWSSWRRRTRRRRFATRRDKPRRHRGGAGQAAEAAEAASGCRGASSASTSRTSRAPRRWRRWWCSSTASRPRASTARSRCKTRRRNDDFASMYEVLSRRFRRSKTARGEASEPKNGWALPDLLVIDGGKGQLGMALAALRDAQIDIGKNGIDVVALAKEREDEERRRSSPIASTACNAKDPMQAARRTRAELFLLARIRDEAHRFANTFHKKLRRRRTLRSALEDVPGVGQKRKRELLKHFGSCKKVRAATVEELLRAPGMSRAAAEAVVRYFQGEPRHPTPRGGAARGAAARRRRRGRAPSRARRDRQRRRRRRGDVDADQTREESGFRAPSSSGSASCRS